MTEILYAPHRERVVTTNAWAFLHWLRMTRETDLRDWAALQRWSATCPAAFGAAMRAFARLPDQLIRPLADVLLHADVRRDDRLLIIGPVWPWVAARLEGTTVMLTDTSQILAAAAAERASVLVAPANALGEVAFRHPGNRPDLARLRTIVATGGPLSPEARRRIYTWVKADLMLLARTGDTYWGNPLEPVLARPPASPAFLTPPASAPARP
jgi:hypothetical protein